MIKIPIIIVSAATNFPAGCVGVTSPYPTVVMVTIDHHIEEIMVWNGLSSPVRGLTFVPHSGLGEPPSIKYIIAEQIITPMATKNISKPRGCMDFDNPSNNNFNPVLYRDSLNILKTRISRTDRMTRNEFVKPEVEFPDLM